MQNKGSNWKFLVGAVAGAFVASRLLGNSQLLLNDGKTRGDAPTSVALNVNLTLKTAEAASQDLTDLKDHGVEVDGINIPIVSKSEASSGSKKEKGYCFGYLPVGNFITALIVAILFKFFNFGMMVQFGKDNSSVDNIYTALTNIAWLLIMLAPILFIFRAKRFMRLVRCALTNGMMFFFDVAFFASAFIIVNILPEHEKSIRNAWFVGFVIVALFLLNHLLLALMGKDVSTLKLVKRIDAFFVIEVPPLSAKWVLGIAVVSFLLISSYFSKYGIPFASEFP
ncbi:hypothetical protein [Pseudomonas gingeri]|uniref:Uncharacterized protein n=1 Tax=Pseudomonas gingeri TaxID=117681 RepID=A0A7Y7YDN4_9PSED|nr:hypothetical protein [Pseudomonas gingeri]NWB27765.1 hypothetical protein [Pseudomonas gingeri]NWC34377.1 hypothetical protein [Pseudomonas gingeri]